jgi:hypothetical protein
MDPIDFNIYEPTDLCYIMRKHCSDKGHPNVNNAWHNYTLFYTKRFKNIKPKRIFELGLGTNNPNIPSNMGPNGVPGASLYGWSEYFPDAKVYGADIDYECLFSTEKIKTFYCNQLNPLSIQKLWQQYELLDGFDIMIDDGCHTFDGIVIFFENSIHKLNRGGYYCIEDIATDQILQWEDKVALWRQKYPNFIFQIFRINNLINKTDNNMIIIYLPPKI